MEYKTKVRLTESEIQCVYLNLDALDGHLSMRVKYMIIESYSKFISTKKLLEIRQGLADCENKIKLELDTFKKEKSDIVGFREMDLIGKRECLKKITDVF